MRRALQRWCNALLALHPADDELATVHRRLRERGFLPPAPRALPEGPLPEVRRQLDRADRDDLAEIARAIVALPDPGQEPEVAHRTLELLLRVPAEAERAAVLLDQLAPLADRADVVAWRFRLGALTLPAEERKNGGAWEALLDVARAHAEVAPAAVARALREAASAWLAAASDVAPPGAAWIVSVLHGERLANAYLAAARRPALRDGLVLLFAWLDEARALDADHRPGGTEGLVARADEADLRGDFDEGTRLLASARERSGHADDLDAALAARAEILLDPSIHPGADPRLSSLARRQVPPTSASRPEVPHRGWSERLAAQADNDGEDYLALLELLGSPARAARGWLARGDLPALLQATRLRGHLSASERESLAGTLGRLAGEDEDHLASDPQVRDAAIARWWNLQPGSERALTRARLAPLLPERPAGEAADDVPDDDPHSIENRLAAASDLLEAGRLDAAGAVLAALLRRAPTGAAMERLARLVTRALELDENLADLHEAVWKHIRDWDDAARALLDALAANPASAYAFHEQLIKLGQDLSRGDHHRLLALEAWLGIWRATKTPPAVSEIGRILEDDSALLPLAAARLAGGEDPVGRALAFLVEHPFDAEHAEAWADELLALSL